MRRDVSPADYRANRTLGVLSSKPMQAMEAQNLSKARMAARMGTNRSQLGRLLDPENAGEVFVDR